MNGKRWSGMERCFCQLQVLEVEQPSIRLIQKDFTGHLQYMMGIMLIQFISIVQVFKFKERNVITAVLFGW